MRKIGSLLMLLVGCAAGEGQDLVNDKAAEVRKAIGPATTLIMFEDMAEKNELACSQYSCDEYCQKDFAQDRADIDMVPDQMSVCWWHEPAALMQVSRITFGSVGAIAYAKNGELLTKDVQVIYTGP